MLKGAYTTGKIILVFAISLWGFSLRQDPSYLDQFRQNLKVYLEFLDRTDLAEYQDKLFRILSNFIGLTILGLYSEFMFTVSGFSLIIMNFVLNFKLVSEGLDQKFILFMIIAFGVLTLSLKTKK